MAKEAKFLKASLTQLILDLQYAGATMDKKLKQKWLRALLTYPQTTGFLFRFKKETRPERGKRKEGYCCLGVLAACQKAPLKEWDEDERGTDLLPAKFTGGLSEESMSLLAQANDAFASFKQIREAIKEGIKGK